MDSHGNSRLGILDIASNANINTLRANGVLIAGGTKEDERNKAL
jgi:hypothetical protein